MDGSKVTRATGLNVIADQPLCYAAGLFRILALDDYRKRSFHTVGNVLERLQCEMGPDPGVCMNGRREADSIQAAVDPHSHATPDLNCLLQEVTQQGKGQKAVRNRGAIGCIPQCTFVIDVNPLPVLRGFRKLPNSVLGDREPFRSCDFATHEAYQGMR